MTLDRKDDRMAGVVGPRKARREHRVTGSARCQPAVQAAPRSPRPVAVDEIQQEADLPPVTADLAWRLLPAIVTQRD